MFNKKVLIAGFFVFVFLGGIGSFVSKAQWWGEGRFCSSCTTDKTFCTAKGQCDFVSGSIHYYGTYDKTVAGKLCGFFLLAGGCRNDKTRTCECRSALADGSPIVHHQHHASCN